MNKSDLSTKLADLAGIPKVRAAEYVNIIFGAIQEELCKEVDEDDRVKVTISDFGTFSLSTRTAFRGRNPRSGEEMDVPERRVAIFKSGKGLKNALNA